MTGRRPYGTRHLDALAKEYRQQEGKRTVRSAATFLRAEVLSPFGDEGSADDRPKEEEIGPERALRTLGALFQVYVQGGVLPEGSRVTLNARKYRLKWKDRSRTEAKAQILEVSWRKTKVRR